MRQLGDALSILHSLGVAHRDIKPANVLFTDASHRHLKLCDFGFAIVCHTRRECRRKCTWGGVTARGGRIQRACRPTRLGVGEGVSCPRTRAPA